MRPNRVSASLSVGAPAASMIRTSLAADTEPFSIGSSHGCRRLSLTQVVRKPTFSEIEPALSLSGFGNVGGQCEQIPVGWCRCYLLRVARLCADRKGVAPPVPLRHREN